MYSIFNIGILLAVNWFIVAHRILFVRFWLLRNYQLKIKEKHAQVRSARITNTPLCYKLDIVVTNILFYILYRTHWKCSFSSVAWFFFILLSIALQLELNQNHNHGRKMISTMIWPISEFSTPSSWFRLFIRLLFARFANIFIQNFYS